MSNIYKYWSSCSSLFCATVTKWWSSILATMVLTPGVRKFGFILPTSRAAMTHISGHGQSLFYLLLLILFKGIPATLQSMSLIDVCRSGTKQSLVCARAYRGWEGQCGISKICRVSFSLQRHLCAASWLGSCTSVWRTHVPISFCICVVVWPVFLHISVVSMLAGVCKQGSVNKWPLTNKWTCKNALVENSTNAAHSGFSCCSNKVHREGEQVTGQSSRPS